MRKARQAAGMKQRGLADRMGVSEQRVCCLETGRAPMTVAMETRVAGALGMSVFVFEFFALDAAERAALPATERNRGKRLLAEWLMEADVPA